MRRVRQPLKDDRSALRTVWREEAAMTCQCRDYVERVTP